MREKDPTLREMARLVYARSGGRGWKWDRISWGVGNLEIRSPRVTLADWWVQVNIEAESPRWLAAFFPTVEVEVDGYKSGLGGSYLAMPWSWESKFLREQWRKERVRNRNGRRTLLEEVERRG
jgi:hypothetical protein